MNNEVLNKLNNLSAMINNTPMLEISLKYQGTERKIVIVTVFADDNKKYLSTELMNGQYARHKHISEDVELVGFKSIR